MAKTGLITGAAAFVESHLADGLLESGYAVRVFDNLAPQVHGTRSSAFVSRARSEIHSRRRSRSRGDQPQVEHGYPHHVSD